MRQASHPASLLVSCADDVMSPAANLLAPSLTSSARIPLDPPADTTPPAFTTLPVNVVGSAANGISSAVVTFPGMVANDTAPGTTVITCSGNFNGGASLLTYSSSPLTTASFPTGNTTVTCWARDAANNTSPNVTFVASVSCATAGYSFSASGSACLGECMQAGRGWHEDWGMLWDSVTLSFLTIGACSSLSFSHFAQSLFIGCVIQYSYLLACSCILSSCRHNGASLLYYRSQPFSICT